jgi:hypothetical protein
LTDSCVGATDVGDGTTYVGVDKGLKKAEEISWGEEGKRSRKMIDGNTSISEVVE